jgi:hypothetical protein
MLEAGRGFWPELIDAAWLAVGIVFLWRAGFVNLKPYPNCTSRQQSRN